MLPTLLSQSFQIEQLANRYAPKCQEILMQIPIYVRQPFVSLFPSQASGLRDKLTLQTGPRLPARCIARDSSKIAVVQPLPDLLALLHTRPPLLGVLPNGILPLRDPRPLLCAQLAIYFREPT